MPVKQTTKFDDVPDWPTAGASVPPPRDHNRPPPEEIIPEEYRAAIIEAKPDFYTLLDLYLGPVDPETGERGEGSVGRAYCNDVESQKRCGDLFKALRMAKQTVERVHPIVKEPYKRAADLVQAQTNALVAQIDPALNYVKRLMDDYQQRQDEARQAEERRQREERERLEALARENNLEQALPPPEPVRKPEPVRSDGGATISSTVQYEVEIVDFAKAARRFKDDAKVRDAILAAAKKLAKDTKGAEIPGIKITTRTTTRVL